MQRKHTSWSVVSDRSQRDANASKVTSKGLDLTVAYVEGDDVLDRAYEILGTSTEEKLEHLDKVNANVQLAKDTKAFLDDRERMPIVSANAYLGVRAIRRGLDEGADIIICGRVADASPVSRLMGKTLKCLKHVTR